jgi:hypothetical protein
LLDRSHRCDGTPQCPSAYHGGEKSPYSDEPVTCNAYKFWNHVGVIVGFLFAVIVSATAIYGLVYCLCSRSNQLGQVLGSTSGSLLALLASAILAGLALFGAIVHDRPFVVKDLLIAVAMSLCATTLWCAYRSLKIVFDERNDGRTGSANLGYEGDVNVDAPKAHPWQFDYGEAVLPMTLW